MKILLLSRSIYPKSGGSSFVTEQLASNFSKGNLVVVGGKDLFFERPLRRHSNAPDFFYLNYKITWKGRGERFLKWIQWLFFMPFNLVKLRKIINNENPDHMLITFPDDYFLYLGYRVAKSKKISYSVYFHNTYLENRAGLKRAKAAYIQNKVFQGAKNIFLMSEGMKTLFERNYPDIDKFSVLPHTFKEFPAVAPMRTELTKGIVNLAFIGNFNQSNIEATRRIIVALKDNKEYQLNFYTPVPKLLLSTRGIDVSRINYQGYISDDNFYEEVSKNDILVLTHGFEGGYSKEEYETIFPTRSLPFLLLKRPILLHSPGGAFLNKIFNQYRAALIVDKPDHELIVESLNELRSNSSLRETLVQNAGIMADYFHGENVVDKLKKEIYQ